VTRAFSHATRCASRNIRCALAVMSSGLPIGTATTKRSRRPERPPPGLHNRCAASLRGFSGGSRRCDDAAIHYRLYYWPRTGGAVLTGPDGWAGAVAGADFAASAAASAPRSCSRRRRRGHARPSPGSRPPRSPRFLLLVGELRIQLIDDRLFFGGFIRLVDTPEGADKPLMLRKRLLNGGGVVRRSRSQQPPMRVYCASALRKSFFSA